MILFSNFLIKLIFDVCMYVLYLMKKCHFILSTFTKLLLSLKYSVITFLKIRSELIFFTLVSVIKQNILSLRMDLLALDSGIEDLLNCKSFQQMRDSRIVFSLFSPKKICICKEKYSNAYCCKQNFSLIVLIYGKRGGQRKKNKVIGFHWVCV